MIDFNDDQNRLFAKNGIGFPQYPLDNAVEWISENLEPGEVFTDGQLRDWARNIGLVEETE